MALKKRSSENHRAIWVGGETSEGLLTTTEETKSILGGTARIPRVDFRLFSFSDSYFSHDEWVCWNPLSVTHLQTARSSRVIKWTSHQLPSQMVTELKAATWIKFVVSNVIPGAIIHTKDTMAFLSELHQHLQGRGLPVNSLADLRIEDIEDGLAQTNKSRALLDRTVRPMLINLTQPHVQTYLGITIPWNAGDIESLPWKRYNREDHTRGRTILSSELFLYRSDLNRAMVREFIEAIGEEPEDVDPNPIYEARRAAGRLLSQQFPAFAALYQAYIEATDFKNQKENKNNSNAASGHFKTSKANVEAYGAQANRMPYGTMSRIVHDHRFAGMQVVSLYTGMRESELKGIQQSVNATGDARCLRQDRDMWFLHSTVAKNAQDGAASGQHRWVAPSVIRDAIRVLECQQPLNKNPFLFSALTSAGGGNRSQGVKRPLSQPAIRIFKMSVLPQLSGTEYEDEIKGWTHHTDRHTLVKELDLAGVQLVHISRQLHHVHMMLAESEGSETTMGYGGIGVHNKPNPGLSSDLEEYREQVKRDRYHAVLGEGALIAGSGADALKKKVDATFQGLGYSGEQRKEYIDQLVSSGFPLPTSGFGICSQQAFEMEEEPPCMGDYECDPNCKSCVVTPERTYQAVAEFRRTIDMQLSDTQKHNFSYWHQREEVFAKILQQLGEDPILIKDAFLADRDAA